MKCPYCKEKVALKVWGQHSQECKDRKRIRAASQGLDIDWYEVEGTEETPSALDSLHADIEDMSKDLLIDYLESEGIEHDPKDKKYKLKKLAKGE